MKIHITNLYNFNKEDQLVQRQHIVADAGRSLGFYEMGIFSYPVETDTIGELSKRLDGVIASLEAEDIVIMQLPTRNGIKYEQFLLNKIKAYKNTKVVLLVHEIFLNQLSYEEKTEYEQLFSMADSVDRKIEGYCINNDFLIKKILLDALDSVFLLQKGYMKACTDNTEEDIHIAFGLHDKNGNYSAWVGVAMQSIIENTNAEICFHILHDATVSESNKKKLTQIAMNGGHQICFHFLDNSSFHEIEVQMGTYTIGAMFRVMLPEILSELSKVIYLDADILANRDIKELWDLDVSNYYMAAVADVDVVRGGVKPIVVKNGKVSAKDYFNSGVLYMNLDKIRNKGNMKDDVVNFLLCNKESDLPDQDALNVIYNKGVYLLDESWNYFARRVRNTGETKIRKCFYHYVGTWCVLYLKTEMDELFYETMSRTPWGQEECRKIREASLNRVADRCEQLEKTLMTLCESEKKHIFYGKETNAMRNMYKMIGLKDNDYRILDIPVEDKNSILPCRRVSEIIDENSDFIIFVLPEADDGKAISNLEKMGYVNEKDFFVIPRLLSYKQGGYIF